MNLRSLGITAALLHENTRNAGDLENSQKETRKLYMAMRSKSRTPSEHPDPHGKIGPKIGSKFTYSKMGSPNGFDKAIYFHEQEERRNCREPLPGLGNF